MSTTGGPWSTPVDNEPVAWLWGTGLETGKSRLDGEMVGLIKDAVERPPVVGGWVGAILTVLKVGWSVGGVAWVKDLAKRGASK